MLQFLQGKKTYIIAVLMVLGSLGSLLAGDVALSEFLKGEDLRLLLGLGLAALRAGVSKA